MSRAASLLLALALLAPAAVRAQELGRLFFTPEQRAALDARRKARVPDRPAAAPVVESPVTRINGVVRRSHGNSTIWVNGQPLPEGAQAEGARIEPGAPTAPARVSVTVGESDVHRDLKVGESLDRGSGEVHDVLGNGEIKVDPARTERRR
ncbi:MAG TPA: hypothetical protein VMI15_02025 [Burkholderiales bacterium]|nr:hypothetical protein [Burkholderiales bacterium]